VSFDERRDVSMPRGDVIPSDDSDPASVDDERRRGDGAIGADCCCCCGGGDCDSCGCCCCCCCCCNDDDDANDDGGTSCDGRRMPAATAYLRGDSSASIDADSLDMRRVDGGSIDNSFECDSRRVEPTDDGSLERARIIDDRGSGGGVARTALLWLLLSFGDNTVDG
jgi:hypothetical protein